MEKLQVVLPPRDWGALEDGLWDLTEAINKIDPELVNHGFLGGEFGYGAHWENETFLMHPYCWCERDDCPWCGGCQCPETAFHYFVDNKEVTFGEWMSFFDHEVYTKATGGKINSFKEWLKLPPEKWNKYDCIDDLRRKANKRRSQRHDPECKYCLGTQNLDKGAEAGHGAPNFWHKPSGFKVWWYKYIGRDMETTSGGDWAATLRECFASLGPKQ
jgi:hypothetical protein